jgi:hypothetical protein
LFGRCQLMLEDLERAMLSFSLSVKRDYNNKCRP